MTQVMTDTETKPARWYSKDLVLLPLLSLLTVVVLGIVVTLVANSIFARATPTTGCLVINDASTGVRAIPGCVCWKGTTESKLAEYRFNACGHRTELSCGPKTPENFRIVMTGSSFGFGMWVPQEKSFAALLPSELSARTGRRVELYNASMQWGFPKSTLLRFHEVLADEPNLILWDLTPEDIQQSDFVLPKSVPPSTSASSTSPSNQDLIDRAKQQLTSKIPGRVLVLARHLLFASRSQYVTSYLAGPDSDQGFLKAELSPLWQGYLEQFDRDASAMEEQAKKAGVPFVAVLLPNRAQAAMISAGEWPAGYDPYHLDNQLRKIIVSHGGTYVSILSEFRSIPNPEKDYFPIDGHIDENGHAMMSHLLAAQLTAGGVPALTQNNEARKPSGQGD